MDDNVAVGEDPAAMAMQPLGTTGPAIMEEVDESDPSVPLQQARAATPSSSSLPPDEGHEVSTTVLTSTPLRAISEEPEDCDITDV